MSIPACHTATLPSGLGLVLKPMPHAQSVAVGVWARAGGRYEPPAVAGISHFVEHLLFKGTRTTSGSCSGTGSRGIHCGKTS